MPELPEVETTRKGIAPYVVGEMIKEIIIRQDQLRWQIPPHLKQTLKNQTIIKLTRRAKYLLFYTKHGCIILHLGMSGSLRISDTSPPAKHDHVDIIFGTGQHCLRYRDPRRFGAILWTNEDPLKHKLLQHLGPEPLSDELNADYLYQCSRNRTQAIKTFIMDSKIVVGIGNIYANEALFIAGIHPHKKAGKISKARYRRLDQAIKETLHHAIKKGGTTLRDFTNSAGKPGYFGHELKVYGRAGEPCDHCKNTVQKSRLGQRATFYCTHCQRH